MRYFSLLLSACTFFLMVTGSSTYFSFFFAFFFILAIVFHSAVGLHLCNRFLFSPSFYFLQSSSICAIEFHLASFFFLHFSIVRFSFFQWFLFFSPLWFVCSLSSACEQDLRKLISQCWHADVDRRPNFKVITERLRVLYNVEKHSNKLCMSALNLNEDEHPKLRGGEAQAFFFVLFPPPEFRFSEIFFTVQSSIWIYTYTVCFISELLLFGRVVFKKTHQCSL